jgi:tetratricopeptide (TPR) repeat protein
LKVAIGGTMGAEFTLGPVQAAAPEAGPEEGQMGGGPKSVRTYNEGVEAQRLGDLELAAEKYREAAELDPELAAAHTALAAVSLLQEDHATAAAEAEAALAIDPTDVRAMQLRFDAYRLLGDEAKAAEAAEQLRQIGDLGDAAARIFNEGVDAFNAGDTATAQSKFKQVVELDPSNVTAYVALSQVSLTQGAPAEALAMAQQALELEPDNVRAQRLAFDGARLSGDEDAARQALDRLVELDPDWLATTVFEHATDLYNANETAAAALELEYVVKANPELAKARFMYGVALYNTGQVEAGREQLKAFLELAPDDPDAAVARGLLEYQE